MSSIISKIKGVLKCEFMVQNSTHFEQEIKLIKTIIWMKTQSKRRRWKEEE
jgi:hypothetical protein